MLYIGISLSTIVCIAAALTVGFSSGLMVRKAIIRKLKRSVLELETEMVENHADILKLTEQIARMENEGCKVDVPVITIGSSKIQGGKTGVSKSS
ncbi:hypothetical protein [Pinibacter soli]|uniref:LapA family protein n=1 Tax=Pinibacter soli TaxID=3044211 RepID=A0ABT6RIS7_9BACT|nr:hypothetical protein [Pinibacter soli]MDI3322473.1 hypothetical protein [Pinibacter soli]